MNEDYKHASHTRLLDRNLRSYTAPKQNIAQVLSKLERKVVNSVVFSPGNPYFRTIWDDKNSSKDKLLKHICLNMISLLMTMPFLLH